MNLYQMCYARLDREKLAGLTALEAKLDSWVVAVEPEVELADLSDAELRELQTAKQELGVILLAYKPVAEAESRPARGRRGRPAPTTG